MVASDLATATIEKDVHFIHLSSCIMHPQLTGAKGQ